ncbi:MAG: hypothetical protein J0H98_01765 [Solirubrobacterales bacterium]|nr:hypothetical protein [Solirubrobacterales bacterium]
MRKIRMILVAAAAIVGFATVSVAPAAADFGGTISMPGVTPTCDFTVPSTGLGPPPDDQTIDGAWMSPRFGPSHRGCDPGEFSLSTTEATFADHDDHGDMTLEAGFSIQKSPCTYTAASDITLHDAETAFGLWSGSGTLTGSPGGCGSKTVTFTDLFYGAGGGPAPFMEGDLEITGIFGGSSSCHFAMPSSGSGAPPAAQDLDGDMFAGWPGGITPCNPALDNISDFSATWTYNDMDVTGGLSGSRAGCAFSSGTGFTLAGGAPPYGPWSTSYPLWTSCSTQLSITDLTYRPW